MAWIKFDSREEFRNWHKQIKTELGYPLDEITTEFTYAKVVSENDIRAWVDAPYNENLQKSTKPPFQNFGDIPFEEIH